MGLSIGLASSLLGCDQTSEETADEATSSPAEDATSDVTLLSFEAMYELSLERTKSSSNIAAYEGLLLLDNIDACDGFATNQRITALISDQDGKNIINDFTMTSWEALDRSLFRYESKVKFNGVTTDETVGRAVREDSDTDGEISFEKPGETDPVLLTPDIQFPTEYIFNLIAAAQAGERVYQSLMTDGTAETVVFDTVTFIGEKNESKDLDFDGANLLNGQAYWPIHMGYHDPDNPDGTPEVELVMNMHENGVGTELVMDYGDFALPGGTERIERDSRRRVLINRVRFKN